MSRKMKDSGVEWIGKIPESWEVRKLSSITEQITDFVASGSFASLNKNVQYLDEPNYAMLVRTVDLSQKNNTKRVYINEHAYNFLSNSNLFGGELILSNVGSVGNVYLYEPMYENASLAPNSIMIRMKESNRYYYYWFLNPRVNDTLKMIGSNAVQTKFNKTQLRQFLVARPDYEKQQLIATFLDQKVSEIDHIIEKTKLSIEEYKKYKQSLITETVTKGLNKNVKMKDIGIEWIGAISVHWKLVKLTNLTSSYSGGTPSRNIKSYWEEGTIPWMSSGEVNKGVIYNTNEMISEKGFKNSSAKYLPVNSVVVALNGQGKTKGMSAIIKIITTVNQSLVGFICDEEQLYYSYLNYCFVASYLYNRSYIAGGNKRDGISAGDLKQSRIPLPQLEEQKEIAIFIDKKCKEIDSLISQKEQLLKELESYKKSLIFECVTGKREVV